MVSCTSAVSYFKQKPTIPFYPEMASCPHCGAKLKQQKSWEKTLVTMQIGAFVAKQTVLECPNGCAMFASKQLRSLVPYKCTYGFDIIEHVGMALFVHCQNGEEIIHEFAGKNVFISEREISYLGRKFVVYLALVHRESREKLRRSMRNRGGYILHVDGTCEGDSPQLFSGLDGISELVLDNIKIPSEKKESLVPFFQRIKQQFGNPLALVHDMGKGILTAIEEVFPGLPDFICHFHFLRDIGKDLLLEDYQAIMTHLRRSKIRKRLGQKAKYLENKMGDNTPEMKGFKESLENGEIKNANIERIPMVATYTLIRWILEAKRESRGYGFPFDRPHLDFYRRLKQTHRLLSGIKGVHLRNEAKDNRALVKLWSQLEEVIGNNELSGSIASIEAKAKVFDKLRKALRIALPSGKDGLNDDGDKVDIRTIKTKVSEFRKWLIADQCRKETYAAMIKQIDKYWKKLFADPMLVNTPQGEVLIAPQRTNNILERFFRNEKRRARKRSGTSSLSKTLKAIIADTPLVRNLQNEEYLGIILNGCTTLAERFSQVDPKLVQRYLKEAEDNQEKLSSDVKKIIRDTEFPQKISALFTQTGNKRTNRHLPT